MKKRLALCLCLCLCLGGLSGCRGQSKKTAVTSVVTTSRALSTTMTIASATTATESTTVSTVSPSSATASTTASTAGTSKSRAIKTTVSTTTVGKDKAVVEGLTPFPRQNYYGRKRLALMPGGQALVRAYDRIVAGVERFKTTIDIRDTWYQYNRQQVELVYSYYRSDYSQHFWLGLAFTYTETTVCPKYNMKLTDVKAAITRFQAAAAEMLSGLAGKSEYDIELALHDRLVDRVTYGKDKYQQNAYGALVDKASVCEGYARAFQYLLHMAGLECIIATGTAKNVNHAWNMAQINGIFYHVDVTYDDPSEAEGFCPHQYFNLSDDRIAKDHTLVVEQGFVAPACPSMEENYYEKNHLSISTPDVADLAKRLSGGRTAVVYMDGNLTEDTLRTFLTTHFPEIYAITGGSGFHMTCYQQEAHITLKT